MQENGAVPDRETDVGSSPLDPRSAGRSSRPYVFATILLGVLVVVAWLGRDRMRPVMAGHPAPDFQAVALDGTPVELSDYRGKVVLVNIWATWCRPCRAEMPSMEALYREFEGTDFEIVAVSVDGRAGRGGSERGVEGPPGGLRAGARSHLPHPARSGGTHRATVPDHGRARVLPRRPGRGDRAARRRGDHLGPPTVSGARPATPGRVSGR